MEAGRTVGLVETNVAQEIETQVTEGVDLAVQYGPSVAKTQGEGEEAINKEPGDIYMDNGEQLGEDTASHKT